jgi:hypothetical protein
LDNVVAVKPAASRINSPAELKYDALGTNAGPVAVRATFAANYFFNL